MIEIINNKEYTHDQDREGDFYQASSVQEMYGPDQNRTLVSSGAGVFVRRTTESLPAGFKRAFQAWCSAPKLSRLPGDNDHLQLTIEGRKLRASKWGTSEALPITVQVRLIWSVSGELSLTAMNGINTVSCSKKFPVLTANDWSKTHRITFPPPPVGSDWDMESGIGCKFILDWGSGANFETPTPGAWIPGARWRVAGTSSFDMVESTMYMTGWQADPDPSNGTTPIAFRPVDYTVELAELQRLFWKSMPPGVPAADGFGSLSGVVSPGIISYTSKGVQDSVSVRLPQVMLSAEPVVVAYCPYPTRQRGEAFAGTPGAWWNFTKNRVSGIAAFSNRGPTGFTIHNPLAEPAGDVILIDAAAKGRPGGP